MKPKRRKTKSRYKAWVKTCSLKFRTWHVNNLLSFTLFLDISYPDWRFYNVYQNDAANRQIASFTKKRRPTGKVV